MHLIKVILFALLVFYKANASAEETDLMITVNHGDHWEMSSQRKLSFGAFLDLELKDLQTRVPQIYWPTVTDKSDMLETLFSAFDATSEKYQNRTMQCGFIQKILDSSFGRAKRKLAKITKNGKICIPRDLPGQDRAQFTSDLIAFFWTEKWLKNKGHYSSLENLIRKQVGKTYRRPEFHVALNLHFDAFGGGFSKSELQLFERDSTLREYAARAKKIDPDGKTPFKLLGPTMEKIVLENPYEMMSSFQPASKIYIASSWGPSEIVELLAHEYGHVFHGETGHNFQWDEREKSLQIYSNRVHEESVAESFSWMTLQGFYYEYPEIKFLHFAKLRTFISLRPTDPHLLGAAAVADLFHTKNGGRFDDLRIFASSLDLDQYFKSKKLDGNLVNLGKIEPLKVPVSFSGASSESFRRE